MNETTLLTSEAVNYSWRQLALRAGITESNLLGTRFEKLGFQFYYDQPENVKKEHPCLIVVPCSNESWQNMLERPSNSLNWFLPHNVIPRGSLSPFDDSIPVLFWGCGCESGKKPFAEKKDNTLIIYADIIASTFFMLSRWEESIIGQRDKHSRFPSTSSVAHRQGFLHLPVVDYWGKILGEWIKSLRPAWQPIGKKFKVLISHDIDHPLRYSTWSQVSRDFLSSNTGNLNWRKAYQQITIAYKSRKNWKVDPYYMGIRMLVNLNKKYGFDSHFYFQASEPGYLDTGYPVNEEPYRSIIKEVHSSGFEIGIHASYRSFDEHNQLIIEKRRLENVIKAKIRGGRQHYLRFSVPYTWRNWEAAGLEYDSTLGYADQIGFRAGTSIPYHPFDFEENRTLSIREIPIITMDSTLKYYKKVDQYTAFQDVILQANRCEAAGGNFTLLWHNSSFYGHAWEKWESFYKNLLETLAYMS